jgi:predicted flap endonuclease-1-like 5' DNA nuclease
MASIIEIEGIGPVFAEKLKGAGVRSITDLLRCGMTAKDRKDLAAATGIDEAKLLEWVNHADLIRVRGIGSEYSDLLEAAGVDTVPELKQRNAKALYEKLVETNTEKKLVRKMPTADQIANWVEQAKELPRVVEY